jgi:ribosomal protein S18 acetylase RimI-like enzyme
VERRGELSSPPSIRLLLPDDAEAYFALRREMLMGAPLAFAASPEDDVAHSAEAVRELLGRAPESVILGAFRPRLVGAVGLARDRHVKASHKAQVFAMYVKPEARGRGIASQLMEAALDHARKLPGISWVQLGVSSSAPEARRLYERLGFRVWGAEPDALRHGGAAVVEYHMALCLEPAG